MSNGLNQKNDKIDLNMIYYRIESIITLFYTKRILLLQLQVSLPIALHFTSFHDTSFSITSIHIISNNNHRNISFIH